MFAKKPLKNFISNKLISIFEPTPMTKTKITNIQQLQAEKQQLATRCTQKETELN